jgi:hypothetical protein
MGVVKQISEMGARMKQAVKKLTPADYEAAFKKAEGLLAEATNAVAHAKGELNASIEQLMDDGQELEIRRLRRAIAEAEQNERDAASDLAHHRLRLERCKVADADAAHAKLRSEVERLGQLLYQRAQLVRDASETLAEKLHEYATVALETQNRSDELLVSERERALAKAGDESEMQQAKRLPTRVTVHDFPALFHQVDIAHLINLDLAVFTMPKPDDMHGIRWPHKNIDMYAVSQGPRFDERVREGVRMLLRALPRTSNDTPPAAA